LVGDSYKLALEASRAVGKYIVLCGVRFMAESAAIVAREGQTVLIPDPAAGCPMADMIDRPAAEAAFERIASVCRLPPVPIAYMNSYANVKSFTGEKGGAVCTSGNAEMILKHYLDSGNAAFFLPDKNLGVNTAAALGIDERRVFTVRRDGSIEGTIPSVGDPAEGLLFLWDGFCHVHKRFTVADVAAAREKHPGIRVIVHPECDREVVAAADLSGSTELIYREIAASPAGSAWSVGTEGSFVARIASSFPDKLVLPLRVSVCMNMSRIRADNLKATLRSIRAHEETGAPLLFPIDVSIDHKRNAEIALTSMMRITEAGK
jgi:quinolinate synthase